MKCLLTIPFSSHLTLGEGPSSCPHPVTTRPWPRRTGREATIEQVGVAFWRGEPFTVTGSSELTVLGKQTDVVTWPPASAQSQRWHLPEPHPPRLGKQLPGLPAPCCWIYQILCFHPHPTPLHVLLRQLQKGDKSLPPNSHWLLFISAVGKRLWTMWGQFMDPRLRSHV